LIWNNDSVIATVPYFKALCNGSSVYFLCQQLQCLDCIC
jgi:hypothetical protein